MSKGGLKELVSSPSLQKQFQKMLLKRMTPAQMAKATKFSKGQCSIQGCKNAGGKSLHAWAKFSGFNQPIPCFVNGCSACNAAGAKSKSPMNFVGPGTKLEKGEPFVLLKHPICTSC